MDRAAFTSAVGSDDADELDPLALADDADPSLAPSAFDTSASAAVSWSLCHAALRALMSSHWCSDMTVVWIPSAPMRCR